MPTNLTNVFIGTSLPTNMVIIIIIKKGRQYKAQKEWYTPYQSEDPSPTIPTKRKGKIVEDYNMDKAA